MNHKKSESESPRKRKIARRATSGIAPRSPRREVRPKAVMLNSIQHP
jgi:hypothetical protein